MSYKDKFGKTKLFSRPIAEGFEELSIGWDFESNQENREERVAMLLYVPCTPKSDHQHIALGLEEAKNLRDWLSDYIKDLEDHNVKKVKSSIHLRE